MLFSVDSGGPLGMYMLAFRKMAHNFPKWLHQFVSYTAIVISSFEP